MTSYICEECLEDFEINKEGLCLCGKCDDKRMEMEALDMKEEYPE